ncbi:hypothetical protein PC116_g32865 [Phytophthora cactorum]|nr:hypothetical protein PC116_g32865 [Phytophthora cactorum]
MRGREETAANQTQSSPFQGLVADPAREACAALRSKSRRPRRG